MSSPLRKAPSEALEGEGRFWGGVASHGSGLQVLTGRCQQRAGSGGSLAQPRVAGTVNGQQPPPRPVGAAAAGPGTMPLSPCKPGLLIASCLLSTSSQHVLLSPL